MEKVGLPGGFDRHGYFHGYTYSVPRRLSVALSCLLGGAAVIEFRPYAADFGVVEGAALASWLLIR